MARPVVGAAALALGRDDDGRRAGRTRGRPARRAPHGAGAAGAHREPLLLAAQKYIGNVLYGVAKAATDKLTADMAHELRRHGVAAVSLYPGLVRTEAVLAAGVFDLSNSESPQFIGRAVAALAGDPEVLRWSGQVVVAAALAREYGFTDLDGRQLRPLTLADVDRP